MRTTIISLLVLIMFQSCENDRFCDGFFYYKITSDSTVSLTYRNKRNNYSTFSLKGIHKMNLTVDIPKYTLHKGKKYKVTGIGEYSFWNTTNFYKVNIPNTCTFIDTAAFGDCSLSEITIPNSINIINDYAFMCCRNLTSINIPDSIDKISKGCFFSCTKLQTIVIPTNITSIEERAFALCGDIKNVYIPSSVVKIEKEAFLHCKETKFHCEIPSKPSDWDDAWNDKESTIEWNATE